ncbi:MAG: cyclic nucleotide-binding domain-containing protein [Magnetococcales bacterium]|nr:cyclic nucleotide-binding domain-containing protein [Magnetococcales bacterium]
MSKIVKINIISGVDWVEIPEAGLKLLCGCPSDVVKHIMKRGLISPAQINGVPYETGPNAILLSDLMLQGGGFSNLAEFPIFQMFYRQGLLLPNHPNNTGEKPLLVGSRQQVEAQIRYIYRGNYGLVSEREIIEAGVSHRWAKELMRMKKFFTGGTIKPADTFLDTCMVEQGEVEIIAGVFIKRQKTNIFEISYKEESVTVDLNLTSSQSYPSPYPLNYYDLKRDYFSVIHSGIGDGWDVIRPSLSSIIIYQGGVYLVDAGPNVVNNLVALGIGINEIEGIFHTHSHDDHFAGLADLIRGDRRIKYYSTSLVRASVTKKLAALLGFEEEQFADFFDVHDLKYDVWNSVCGLDVKPMHSPHPVESVIFMFRTLWEGGYRSYGHFADITAKSVLQSMVVEDKNRVGIDKSEFERVMSNYLLPVDLKKIDAGGGFIHGDAADFRGDKSKKKILGHLDRPLNRIEKEIGSGAPFGTIDTLIPGFQNHYWRCANDYLTSYFPNAMPYQIRSLFNNSIMTFNPEEIILQEYEVNENIYLVLSGNVELLSPASESVNILYAGSIIGETSGIYNRQSTTTYRAMSYVKALRIPCNLYIDFVTNNDMYTILEKYQEQRDFMRNSWLFGEGISYGTQNRIAHVMESFTLLEGEEIIPEEDEPSIYFIISGTVERFVGASVLETISTHDIFGEERLLFGIPGLFRLRVASPLVAYKIPHETIRHIPIIRWKLLESYNKRSRGWMESDTGEEHLLQWHEEFSVAVDEMDDHHKKLFVMSEEVIRAVALGDSQVAERALAFLIDYAKFHFEAEEEMLETEKYPDLQPHKRIHERLMETIIQLINSYLARSRNIIQRVV